MRISKYTIYAIVAFATNIFFNANADDYLKRNIPSPLPEHPGNVFLEGEIVRIKLPDGVWRLLDYNNKVLFQAKPENGITELGKLPTGFYRLSRPGDTNWISLAVLEQLKKPTPLTSPICLDVAMAWFYPEEQMPLAANLCALAGVNWSRDRLNWAEVEPQKGKFIEKTRYDSSAYCQTAAGLQVLQVNHISPKWASENTHRFPPDLRDAYQFYLEMAKQWRGYVMAFEPWNEADIPNFGGHTGAEMASFQKATYLALKKGNPKIIACLNVFAVHNKAQLEDLADNQTAPYFDTYNFHHYEPFDNYPILYGDHRAVSAGKPLWVTEAALPVKWSGDEKLKELSDEDLKLQSERVVKTFACSLNEGSAATFYFLLPHYVEGQVQFGLLRKDLTPRPGYVALAACGRLLADAKPIGRWQYENPDLRAFLFDSKPDGTRRNVLVIWSAKNNIDVTLPSKSVEIYDHLGRNISLENIRQHGDKNSTYYSINISTAPLFLIFDRNDKDKFAVQKPQSAPVEKTEKPSTIVLQASEKPEKIDLKNSAYKVSRDKQFALPVNIYNFGDSQVKGALTIETPKDWAAVFTEKIDLNPMEKKEVLIKVLPNFSPNEKVGKIKIIGNFGKGGKSVLSVRFIPE